jgi:small subunit ribosomal protein S6
LPSQIFRPLEKLEARIWLKASTASDVPAGELVNFLNIIMATNNLQSYELMAIFTPVLSEDDYKSAQKKYSDFITSHGGEIVHQDSWGLRSLAYPIQKKTTGLYFVLEYNAPTDVNEKLEVQMNRDESIIRHMVTRLDKFAAAYNVRKRNKNLAAETAA